MLAAALAESKAEHDAQLAATARTEADELARALALSILVRSLSVLVETRTGQQDKDSTPHTSSDSHHSEGECISLRCHRPCPLKHLPLNKLSSFESTRETNASVFSLAISCWKTGKRRVLSEWDRKRPRNGEIRLF